MRKRLATALCAIAGLGMVTAGIGVHPSDASSLPSACVYASVDAAGVVTTTIVKDLNGSTCPSLPPDPSNPCPGGMPQAHVHPTIGTVVDVEVMACLKNLP